MFCLIAILIGCLEYLLLFAATVLYFSETHFRSHRPVATFSNRIFPVRIMPGINEGGRPSQMSAQHPSIARICSYLRGLGLEFVAGLIVPAEGGDRSLELLAMENIILRVALIRSDQVRASALVDLFLDFLAQVHQVQVVHQGTLTPFIDGARADIMVLVNRVLESGSEASVNAAARETMMVILLAVLNCGVREALFNI